MNIPAKATTRVDFPSFVSADRQLIVNADDFGYSRGINRGIIDAHEQGIVTSASLMVRWPDAVEAAALARAHPRLSVGLHLDFGEWHVHEGQRRARYAFVPPEASVVDYQAEMLRQLDDFRALMGRDPSHLDSHQHCHLREPVRAIVQRLSREMRWPLRGVAPAICYCGAFYGQGAKGNRNPEKLTPAALCELFTKFPPGITELGCHPASAIDFESSYSVERTVEYATLRDESVARTLAGLGIRLISFHDVSY